MSHPPVDPYLEAAEFRADYHFRDREPGSVSAAEYAALRDEIYERIRPKVVFEALEFRIERRDESTEWSRLVDYVVLEPGEERSTIKVRLRKDLPRSTRPDGERPPRISFPSTSDKRPLVARALSVVLRLAAEEAARIEREAEGPPEMTREQEAAVSGFCSANGGEAVSARLEFDVGRGDWVAIATTRAGACAHYDEDGRLVGASIYHDHGVDWSEVDE